MRTFKRFLESKWMQKVAKSVEERGTEGICTGKRFGSQSCPPGSKQYALAKTFKKAAKKRKKKKE
jgi:hypothetical protein